MKEVKEFRNGNLMVPPANAPMTLTLIESACEDVYTQTSYDPSFELSRDRLLLGEWHIEDSIYYIFVASFEWMG